MIIGLSIFCWYALGFWVSYVLVWNAMENRKADIAEYRLLCTMDKALELMQTEENVYNINADKLTEQQTIADDIRIESLDSNNLKEKLDEYFEKTLDILP